MRPLSARPIVAALVLAAGACGAHAQDAGSYPGKPVTLVVPAAAGGGTDAVARLFADVLGKAMKQSFVVDNRPGANGILGTDYVAKGSADGSRLLFTYAGAMVIGPSLYKKLPFDPLKDFAPIAQIGDGGSLLLVRKDLPVDTLKEFAAYAKAHPGKLNYCSWGLGSGGHLSMESFIKQAGVSMTHVPYKGSILCVQDLVGGQLDAAFGDVPSSTELVKSGRVKALAYSGAKRVPFLPEVPTMTEAGYPFTNYAWFGFFAPARTPPAIVGKLNAAILQALQDPDVARRLRTIYVVDLPLTTPEQFGATVRKDLRDWSDLAKAIGLSLD